MAAIISTLRILNAVCVVRCLGALAIKDIDSNERVSGSMKYIWLGIVYLVPFFGVLVYHLVGPSAISRSMKLAAIVGGLFSYIAILVAGAVISGLV